MGCTYPASTRAHHIGCHPAAVVAGIFTKLAFPRGIDPSHFPRIPIDYYVGTLHRFCLTRPHEW